MNSWNPLSWLRYALGLVASGLWSVVAWLLDALRYVSGVSAGLAVLVAALATFFAARLMQRRLVTLLAADPERKVRWIDLELWFSLAGLLWLPIHFTRKLVLYLSGRLNRRLRPASAAAPTGGPQAAAEAEPKAAAEPSLTPLLVATLGPSFLLGGVATVGLYGTVLLAEPLLRAQLGLGSGTPAWQFLLLGRRPELGLYLPLQNSAFQAGLLSVLFWLSVSWWAARLVRLVYRRLLGSNRYADREDDSVLPLWRQWAGVTFLAAPTASYLNWSRWLVAAAFPLLAWAWLSLSGRPFRVEASEFGVAFVLWLSWATHLSLRGLEREPEKTVALVDSPVTEAAGWSDVLSWLEQRHQVAPPLELDAPRPVEALHLSEIPPETDAVLSPLLLDFVPKRGKDQGRLTSMQRVLLTDLSLLAYVHLDPPIDRDRLELSGAAGEVLADKSGLRKRHQVVIAPESAGKTTLALLAAANHVLVHTRSALVVARDDAAEAAIYQRFRDTVEPTTLRWNVRIRRAGTDLMNDLAQGIAPDVVVISLQRLAVDLLGNEGLFVRFLENLGLIVVDDVESFAGPVEDHAQLAFLRLAARLCRLLGLRDLDQRGAPLFLVLGTDSMDDLPAWARALCGIDAVTRDFTRSKEESEEREMAEQLARGIPARSTAPAEGKESHDLLQRVRQGQHQVFYRLRDFRTATGEALSAKDLVAACEQLAVPWHYRACGDGRRRLGRVPLLLRDEPTRFVEAPEDACVVLLAGHWSEVRRERRRQRRAGARVSRRRSRDGEAEAGNAAGPEPIAFVTLVDPDEEMAFTQLDERFGLAEALARVPYPVLRSPSGLIRRAHLAADLVQHWIEVEDLLKVYGAGTAVTLTRLSRAGVLLADPGVDVHPDAPRYERKLHVRVLARATPSPDATPVEAAAAPLPPQVAEVEVVSPAVVQVRDRIRSLLLARVDAAARGLVYYPGRIFHDARGSYVVVGRAAAEPTRDQLVGEVDDVEVEPVLVDDVSSPRRRVRFHAPAPGPLAAALPAPTDAEGPEEPALGPEPLLIGELPILVALLPVELTSEHVATYRLGPVFREVRQRQILDGEQRERTRRGKLRTWAAALYPNPQSASARPGAPVLELDPARLLAAAMRAILPSMYRGAADRLEVALRVEAETPATTHQLGPWEGFYLFDLADGGNGTARALHRDKVEELLRLARLLIERVLDPSRLLAVYDHWGDEAEILASEKSGGLEDGGGERWQTARRLALIWLDSRLRPEGQAEGMQPVPGRFVGGQQEGEGDLIDVGRCWYSRDRAVSDLVWMKHRWRLPDGREAMLDVGFDRETTAGARQLTEGSRLLAMYQALYEALLAVPALRLADGTVWGAPREVWIPGEDGRTAESCREGLAAEPLSYYRSLAWSMGAHGFAAISTLAQTLRDRAGAGEGEAGRAALLSYLAHFVQGIPYSIPGALRSGLRPPVSTLLYRLGDCDSKSLLLALLAQSCGIPSGLFVSYQDGHALAAVAAPEPLAPESSVEAEAPADSAVPESPAGEPDEEPENPVLRRLKAWCALSGVPGPPGLWGQLPVKPGEEAVHLYVPIESTAYLPVGFVRVGHPRSWIFLPLVELGCELPRDEDHSVMPRDRAEHESRS